MSNLIKLLVGIALVLGLIAVILILLPDNKEVAIDKIQDASTPVETVSSVSKVELQETGAEEADSISHEKSTMEPLSRKLIITGHVRDREDVQAIHEACVKASMLPIQGDKGKTQEFTDETGRFLLEIARKKDQELSGLELAISAEGYRNFKSFIPFDDQQSSLDVGDYYLTRDREHVIRVVDESHAPIPGAQLRLYFGLIKSPILERITDQEGCVRLHDQDLALRGPMRNIGLHVIAEGMSDYFHDNREPKDDAGFLPEEIVMIPARVWSGVVVDTETKQGIEGARVGFISSFMFREIIDALSARTAETGRFELQLIHTSFRSYPRIQAKDYERWSSIKDINYPSCIELRKIRDSEFSCSLDYLAVDAETKQPLANATICWEMRGYKETTDDSGLFRLRLARNQSNYLTLSIPDRKLAYRGFLNPDDLETSPPVIPFEPIIRDKMRILVKDEIGNPVVNAKARLKIGNTNQDRFTEGDGTASYNLMVIGSGEISFIIRHPDFITQRTETITLDPIDEKDVSELESDEDDLDFQFVLKRGTVLQNIRVVDDEGVPVVHAGLRAAVTLEDGSEEGLYGHTDRYGTCDMTFPPFVEGTLHVFNRPDTLVYIDYDTVLQREAITLILYDEIIPGHTIQGVIREESGKPLKNIFVWPSVTQGKAQWFDWIRTKGDGSFSFPAFPDRIYRISIKPIFQEDGWYVAEDQGPLTAGAQLDVTMKSMNGVEVTLNDMNKNRKSRLEYDAWLEDEYGKIISVKLIRKNYRKVYFLDVPAGTMRAKVITKEGEQYLTPFFELEEGKSYLADIYIK
jgi:hypothetical protein